MDYLGVFDVRAIPRINSATKQVANLLNSAVLLTDTEQTLAVHRVQSGSDALN